MKSNLAVIEVLWIGLVLVFFGIPCSAETEAPAGSIKTIESSGWIFRGDEKLAAEPGTRLFSGDLLQTGPQGAMGIILRDNTLISMGPDSELVLNEFIFEPREGRFSLIAEMAKGTFSFLSGMIGKLSPESARIDTPVGTVGIRGTRFFAKVEGSR
ncbi:MAG: FecR family protein [Thermodesulfobacteriota bacterium]